MCWVYFAFGATTAITTDANTWRISVLSTNASAYLINDATSGYDYAVVLTATTSYSSGDSILVKQAITVTVDQSITATTLVTGVDTTIQWANPPAASYTLTVTTWYMSLSGRFIYAPTPCPSRGRARDGHRQTLYQGSGYLATVTKPGRCTAPNPRIGTLPQRQRHNPAEKHRHDQRYVRVLGAR